MKQTLQISLLLKETRVRCQLVAKSYWWSSTAPYLKDMGLSVQFVGWNITS